MGLLPLCLLRNFISSRSEMLSFQVTNSVSTDVPDRGDALIGIMWPLTALACVTAGLRILIRVRKRAFGYDDFFMIVAATCFIGWSTSLTVYAKYGGLQHFQDIQKAGVENLALVLFLNWLSQVFGILGVAVGKISVAALLLAIINLTELRWQRIYLWSVTIVLASLVAISCSILTFAQCSPAKFLWDKRVGGTCIDPQVMASYGTFTGSFNTFADASLAIIPATIFWKLNNSAIEKVQLTIVFGLNILTSICSGIKTQYLVELSNRTDQTWATYDIFVWVTAELFLIIVCGTIPALHPVLQFLRGAFSLLSNKLSQPCKTTSTTPFSQDAELSFVNHQRVGFKTSKEQAVVRAESSDRLVEDVTTNNYEHTIG
ncbi:hypothetical protein AK830_g712 [Neonectria ditissima]|uniref:Rhodopsin domain-containing protein n=1 Tax=Neonectria ditissima TaxID=78410 RepID=A0A0P7BWH3_9HYPO|nr:hypothetical protein AK830_g712 [Neonectria ditissima]